MKKNFPNRIDAIITNDTDEYLDLKEELYAKKKNATIFLNSPKTIYTSETTIIGGVTRSLKVTYFCDTRKTKAEYEQLYLYYQTEPEEKEQQSASVFVGDVVRAKFFVKPVESITEYVGCEPNPNHFYYSVDYSMPEHCVVYKKQRKDFNNKYDYNEELLTASYPMNKKSGEELGAALLTLGRVDKHLFQLLEYLSTKGSAKNPSKPEAIIRYISGNQKFSSL